MSDLKNNSEPNPTLQISGKVNLNEPLKKHREYDIAIRGCVTEIRDKTIKQNEMLYIFEPLFIGYQNDVGERVILLPKGSHSKRARGSLWHYFEDNQLEGDFDEDFYNPFYDTLIRNPEPFVELANKLKNA